MKEKKLKKIYNNSKHRSFLQFESTIINEVKKK